MRSIAAAVVALGDYRPVTAPLSRIAWSWALTIAATTTAATLLPCAATALAAAPPPSASRPTARVPARRCQIRTGWSTREREPLLLLRPPRHPHRVLGAQVALCTLPGPLPAPGCQCFQDQPSATIRPPSCIRTGRCFWPARGPCVVRSLEQRPGLGVSLGPSMRVGRWAPGSALPIPLLILVLGLEPRLMTLHVFAYLDYSPQRSVPVRRSAGAIPHPSAHLGSHGVPGQPHLRPRFL